MTHTINTPLLRKALEHITLHPGEWNQSTWFGASCTSPCGTAGCLAGWAAVLSGVPLAYADYDGVLVPSGSTDGRPIAQVATDELRLNPALAGILFDGGNTLEMLWSMAASFTRGDIQSSEMDALLAVPVWEPATPAVPTAAPTTAEVCV